MDACCGAYGCAAGIDGASEMVDDVSKIRKYRPSCGSEGADFIDRWCGRCKRDEAFRNEIGDSCPIVRNTFVYDLDDPKYPTEWQYDYHGIPRCTAFEEMGTPDKRDENAAIRDLFA